jgi:anaerobic selenocysteine-containing dehydrogenase
MGKIDRRELFKLAALTGACATADACSLVPVEPARRASGPERFVTTACGACPAGCGISVRVVAGNAVRVDGVAGHPVNDGGLCPRGIAEIQNLYHPDRLRGPTARERTPASGERTPLSWDAALSRLAEAIRKHGAIIGHGTISAAERVLLLKVASKIGATLVPMELPFGAPPADGLGHQLGSERYGFDLPRSSAVLSLGVDWLQSAPSPVETQRALPTIRRSGARGKLVTASARLSITAAKSDLWLPIAPGREAFLGLALGRAALDERNEAFFRGRSGDVTGFDAFLALLSEERFAPEQAAVTLGIPAATLRRAASQLADERAVVVVDRVDRARQLAGVALNLFIGAVDREGGQRPVARLPPEIPDQQTRSVEATRGQIIVLYRPEPLALALPGFAWKDRLAGAPLMACATTHLDECAIASDLLLPLSTPLESRGLAFGSTLSGQAFATAGPAAVPRLHDSLDGPELLIRLAAALGATLPFRDAGDFLESTARTLGAEGALSDGGFVAVGEATLEPPGLRRFAVEEIRAALDDPPEDPAHPLLLDLHVPLAFRGGEGAHIPILHGLSGPEGREAFVSMVEIHPDTARAAGVGDRTRVTVESSAGRVFAVTRVRQGVRPGVAAMAVGMGRGALGPYATAGANPLELVGGDGLSRVRVRIRRAR